MPRWEAHSLFLRTRYPVTPSDDQVYWSLRSVRHRMTIMPMLNAMGDPGKAIKTMLRSGLVNLITSTNAADTLVMSDGMTSSLVTPRSRIGVEGYRLVLESGASGTGSLLLSNHGLREVEPPTLDTR